MAEGVWVCAEAAPGAAHPQRVWASPGPQVSFLGASVSQASPSKPQVLEEVSPVLWRRSQAITWTQPRRVREGRLCPASLEERLQ